MMVEFSHPLRNVHGSRQTDFTFPGEYTLQKMICRLPTHISVKKRIKKKTRKQYFIEKKVFPTIVIICLYYSIVYERGKKLELRSCSLMTGRLLKMAQDNDDSEFPISRYCRCGNIDDPYSRGEYQERRPSQRRDSLEANRYVGSLQLSSLPQQPKKRPLLL